jgi:tetratricopeptide (TPR) repeat protein
VEGELTRSIAEARAAGLTLQMHRGFQLLGDLHFLNGDFGSALDGSLRAQEAGRAADPATVVRAIADTARCLGILERDMARAERLAREAEALADGTGYAGHELPQALGYVHHHAGRLDEAVTCFERAARLALDERERWFQCACLSRLVMIELERGSDDALWRAEELLTVTRPLGEGSDGPFAEALEALARRQAGEAETSTPLDAALGALRDADSRWMIAYVQNTTGMLDVDAGDAERARLRADEALESALVAGRSSEVAVARALLARVEVAAGDRAAAAAQLDAIREGPAQVAGGLCARARHAIDAAADTLDGAH